MSALRRPRLPAEIFRRCGAVGGIALVLLLSVLTASPELHHLLHGQADGIVPAQASIEAQAQLAALKADVTLDLFPGLGHGIDTRMSARLWELLAAAE